MHQVCLLIGLLYILIANNLIKHLVHSLAAGLFLQTDEVHYFEDIGYQHDLYRHCPSKESGLSCRCDCPQGTNEKSIDHDKNYDTCLPVWLKHVKDDEKKKANWNVWS